jgi:hypothetical protein
LEHIDNIFGLQTTIGAGKCFWCMHIIAKNFATAYSKREQKKRKNQVVICGNI